MNVSDLAAGLHSPDDGWCDPYALLQGFKRKARSLGATYVRDRVVGFARDGGYSGGLVDSDEPRDFNFEVDHGYFESVVWPALAHRFPAFEAMRCKRSWAGLYDQCELDGNPLIGPAGLDNFHVVAGFSGHGMMHAPAARSSN